MSSTTNTSFIQPYLFFTGRCDEAIQFYQKAIGAEVEMIMRFRENPDPNPPVTLPPGWENKVMHASLRVGSVVLMASDGCASEQSGFQGFSLSLSVENEIDAGRVFAALSEEGKVTMPLGRTFWSPCFGMVEDKFGVGWMVTVIHSGTK